MKSFTLVFALIFSGGLHAATLIDFDSETVGVADPLIVDGFRFEAFGSSWTSEVIEESPGDKAYYLGVGGVFDLFGGAGPIFIRLSAADGQAFSLFSVDMIAANFSGVTVSPYIEGYMAGGGYATGAVGSADWMNLEYVDFGVSSCCGVGGSQPEFLEVTIDNVMVQAVPIPAAAWLFGSALAGLGWLRRRSQA